MPTFKKSSGFKMRGFSGFGNSPLKQNVPMAPGAAAGAKAAKEKTTKPGVSDKMYVPVDPKKSKVEHKKYKYVPVDPKKSKIDDTMPVPVNPKKSKKDFGFKKFIKGKINQPVIKQK
jgi:hypothetical protein